MVFLPASRYINAMLVVANFWQQNALIYQSYGTCIQAVNNLYSTC